MGTSGWQIAKNLTSIDISFEGAHYCPNGSPITAIGPNAAGTTLTPTSSPPKGLNVWLTRYFIAKDVVICWLKTGDYIPTLSLHFGIEGWRSQDYPEYSIHVEPAIVTEELKANRNIQAIEVTAIAIGVFEAFNIVSERERKSKTQSKIGQHKNATNEGETKDNRATVQPSHERRSRKKEAQNDRRNGS